MDFEKSELTEKIVQASYEVHQNLQGPGLLESIYESALCCELKLMGIQTRRQVPVAVIYKAQEIREPMFIDVIVEDEIVLEIKATGKDYPMYRAQLATYLRLANRGKGMLINFGKEDLKGGIIQMVNPLQQVGV